MLLLIVAGRIISQLAYAITAMPLLLQRVTHA